MFTSSKMTSQPWVSRSLRTSSSIAGGEPKCVASIPASDRSRIIARATATSSSITATLTPAG